METRSSTALARELDERLMELQSLFEMSQVLNASLNLRNVLNNLLLTPMGRMMISRGLVLLANENGAFEVSILKGLSRDLAGKKLYFENAVDEPLTIAQIPKQNRTLKAFWVELELELVIPITSNQGTVGLIGFGRKLGGVDYSPAEIEYLMSLANIASSAIINALMFQKIELINRRLDKKIQELKTLFEIGKELNANLDMERIINLLIYAVMGELVVNRCFVFLKEDEGMKLFSARGLRVDDDTRTLLCQNSFLEQLALTQTAIIIDETELHPALRVLQDQQLKLIIPMQNQEETRGVLIVGEKISQHPYQNDEVEFLSTLCNQAMISIENARLFEETLEKERIEEELSIAREIQQRLLPNQCPNTDQISICGMNIPSRQVGGDYFDCIKIDEDHLVVAIADVSGKGIPASLLMSSLQAGLHNLIDLNLDLSTLVAKLNNFIHANTSVDKFITFFIGLFDFGDGTFTYVNAGHNPPLLLRADGSLQQLDVGGLLLGMMPNAVYEYQTITMIKEDVILLFTDGVTEAKSVNDEDFEDEKLVRLLLESFRLPIEELLKTISDEIDLFTKDAPQSDDITMMGIRWLA